jgi:hypothetical protein
MKELRKWSYAIAAVGLIIVQNWDAASAVILMGFYMETILK